MALEWKDVSSRSRGELVVEPKSVRAEVGWLRIDVTRHLHFPPDAWVLRCPPIGVDLHLLKATTLEAAKDEAIGIVYKAVSTVAFALALDGK